MVKAKNRERRYLEKVLRRHQRAHARSQMEKDGVSSIHTDLPAEKSQVFDHKVSMDQTDDGKNVMSRRIMEVSRSAEDSNVRVTPVRGRSEQGSIRPAADMNESQREYAS